ncbi:MAG: ABC transporter substrate-binding protein [Candidatus Choladocola sp.]|nr:ABC transporter substrate-binding protein [Candidatus Choladocola sp.]
MKKRICKLCALFLAAAALSCNAALAEETVVRVGSLKGPTSMGIVSMMEKSEAGETSYDYEFTMAAAADELLAQVISQDLDIAMVPANVASVLYNKTEGGVHVVDINTLGVLYIVECGDSIRSISDLAGKTVYLTGKGTSPDYVLQYLLKENGLTADDVTLEYKSEATEVVSVLAGDSSAIGLLPQPFVTAASMQNESLHIALDLTKEWENIQKESGSSLVTGVTIVRDGFLKENPDAVEDFLAEHELSAAYTNEHPAEAAEKIAALGIVAKAPIAEKAIPYCNITCIEGEEMQSALSGYLGVLYSLDPAAVGGSLPAEDFYYIP